MKEKCEWINKQLTPKKETAEGSLQHGRGLLRVQAWEDRTGSHSAAQGLAEGNPVSAELEQEIGMLSRSAVVTCSDCSREE